MTMLSTNGDLRQQTADMFTRKKRIALTVTAVIFAYFVYVFIAFDVAGLADRARMDNARTLVADAYSYKTHVARDNRDAELSFAIEGSRAGTYTAGEYPEWVA